MGFLNLANEYDNLLNEGKKIYRGLLELTEDETDYLICPEHIGDSIWICAFISDYIKTHECDRVYVIGKESQIEILAGFKDVSGTISLTSDEMNALRVYIAHYKLWKNNHIFYTHFKGVIVVDEHGFHFIQVPVENAWISMKRTRKILLEIPNDYDVTPSRLRRFDDGNNNELREMFSNAVLFVPTMQTQGGYIEDGFFDKLVKEYTALGYNCFTNYNSFSYERMIKDTQPLASTLKEFAIIAPYFAQVIAVRSGAADLLAEVDANVSVLYHWKDVQDHSHVEATAEEIGQMTVTDLVQRDNLKEYVYLEDREEELITALLKQCKPMGS